MMLSCGYSLVETVADGKACKIMGCFAITAGNNSRDWCLEVMSKVYTYQGFFCRAELHDAVCRSRDKWGGALLRQGVLWYEMALGLQSDAWVGRRVYNVVSIFGASPFGLGLKLNSFYWLHDD